MTEFVHLHVHSDFSLQDAAVSVMSLADRAEELGMKYLALTDHGNMFGAMEFLAACEETINERGEHVKRRCPIHPIIGCEVYVAPSSRHEKKGAESDNKYYHLILLASNREGYFNLVKLCSLAYTEGFYYRPRVDEELLAQYHGGLIALSACVAGEIPRLIQAGKSEEAAAKARHYRDLFGKDEQGNPNFYLEIQDHGITAAWLKGNLSQRQINDVLVDISRKNGIPLAATNDVHYLKQEDAGAHDVLLCIGTAKLRSDERRKRYFGDQFYLKSGDEMAALFPEYPEALANTVRIAERCNADVPRVKTKDLPRYLPEFEIPAGFQNADEYLRHLTMEGLAKRYPDLPDQVMRQAEYELDTIISMNFTGYFLIVADFCNWAKEHGIWVGPGRGSGAGSIVAYAVRITDIDPLKYGLLFERFLNPERISMPDFDIDFCNERREEVIKYVTDKYGKEKVGQIITFGTLGAKQVVRDVARALSISIPESEMITKLIPKDPKITLAKAFAEEPKLRDMEQENPKYAELFSLARKLEGLNRHSSLHAAGIVIGKTALTDYVPLYREPESKGGSIATQYTMNFLEGCGLVKMDFLGLKTLDLIKNTQDLIRERGARYADFDIETIPEDDPATYTMLAEEKNEGVFQFEKTWWKEILKKAKPVSIEELTALNSLGRPGPMQYVPRFIESKWGRQKIEYPDPSLEEVLKETYGVIVYQEQVMQVARIIAGYSMGQADLLRRAMGKKKKEIINKEKTPFIAGAIKQGFSEATAGRIYDILVPFAEYGFNKSHAAAYSVLSYRTAWLKANFPAEFMAANLTNEIGSPDKDKLSAYIEVARKMGLAIDPPDINRSQKYFSVADGRIFYGFLGIKGLGDAAADEIVACRKDGPYKNFIDFLDRVNIKTVGKSVVGLLIQTGAFDGFGVSRSVLMGNLERAVEYAQGRKDDKQFGQTSLFEDTGEKEYPDFVFEPFPETGRAEKLKAEKELIGFYFSGHPMDDYKDLWQRVVKTDLGKLETAALGNCVLLGIVKTVKTINTAKGGKMAFATLSDYNGEIEMIFFPGPWERCQNKIEAGEVAILKGRLEYQKDKDRYNFLAEDWVSPEEAEAVAAQAEAQARKWDKYRNVWKYKTDLKLSNPASASKGTYTIAGFLTSLREITDKKGNPMAFGTLRDFEGEIDLVFFASVWKECKDILTVDEFTVLKGNIDPANDKTPEKPGFKVSSVPDLTRLMRAAAKEDAANAAGKHEAPCREVHILLSETAVRQEADLYPLRERLAENPGPCLVFIHVPVPGGEAVIRTASRMAAEGARFEALSSCTGVADVRRA
ncbi:MAG: DNA polymerase III subunit alpha [Treponema sp.]|jgi:DNA polymerase-3 subunit alpha|nr:DNA polymerase III subunit alpha [Treponema sp.]